jgi:cytochrome P450
LVNNDFNDLLNLRTFGMGNTPMLTIAEPDLIKQITVKDFHLFRNRRSNKVSNKYFEKEMTRALDDNWKRLRSIVTPTFTSGKIKKMYHLIRDCTREYLENFEKHAMEGSDADLKTLHGNFTMDVIAKCAFATTTNANKDPQDIFIVNAKKMFEFSKLKYILIALLPKGVLKLIGIKSLRSDEAQNFFGEITKQIIRKRRQNKEKHSDFLQMLMDVSKDDHDKESENVDAESHHVNEGEEEIEVAKKELDVKFAKKKLDEDEIVAQVSE